MLFKSGEFTSHSGLKLDWKVECDVLDKEDWEVLARVIAMHVQPFCIVLGIPRGGLPLANALYQYRVRHNCTSILIVDDVLTTGKSMEKARNDILATTNLVGCVIMGAVAFARGPCPMWVYAVWQSG